jgi:hypothetical protein
MGTGFGTGKWERCSQHPIIYKQIYRNFVQRFPFGVYYLVKQDLVLVIAVLHVRRNPLHWQKRV